MKPVSISHVNKFDDFDDVVINVELTDTDKMEIYKYHIKNNGRDYDWQDISVLAFLNVEYK